MNDSTAVTLAAGRVRRGNVTGALQLLTRQAEFLICRYCDRPMESWPTEDCQEPRTHTATVECACGESLTFAEVVDERWRHSRCRTRVVTAARGAYPPVDGSSADDVAVAEVVTAPKPRCGASTVRHPDDFCDEPATVPVSVACVHEHVRDSHACPVHAALLEEHICALCWRADGHRCRLMLLASA